MKHLSAFPEQIQKAFEPAQRGVVELVNDLLDVCPEPGLQLDWQAGRCHVRPLGANPGETIEVSLPKSVFRGILARIAVLCNEHTPNSVSPYGGEGELTARSNQSMNFHVIFANTPGEQRLELRHFAR